jgi:hypothetical protein
LQIKACELGLLDDADAPAAVPASPGKTKESLAV